MAEKYRVVSDVKEVEKAPRQSTLEIYLADAPEGKSPKKGVPDVGAPKEVKEAFSSFAENSKAEFSAGAIVSLDLNPATTVSIAVLPKKPETFGLLGFARKLVQTAKDRKRRSLVVNLPQGELASRLADAIVSAAVVADFKCETYKKEDKKDETSLTVVLVSSKKTVKEVEAAAEHATITASMTNLVRNLSILPANVLTCKTYVERAQKLAKEAKLQTKFYDFKELEKLKAGAFLAVAQGSGHRDAGILKISYPGKKKKRVCVVGKGITFDTGGVNLKPPQYMHGMHGDMAGSAVALAIVLLAAEEEWDTGVDCFMAIADNAISNIAFRPNEVVYAMNGTSIETVDTDAEGRMVLADTLCLASNTKPDLILDFATLTGAAVRAVGKTYAAGFTNRKKLMDTIREAGEESGERCWPFPTDGDYLEALESEIADIKQCMVTPGPDHIWAAVFLQKFVSEDIPYIHIDLSSIERDGGLAHVPGKETGLGVRLGATIIEKVLGR